MTKEYGETEVDLQRAELKHNSQNPKSHSMYLCHAFDSFEGGREKQFLINDRRRQQPDTTSSSPLLD